MNRREAKTLLKMGIESIALMTEVSSFSGCHDTVKYWPECWHLIKAYAEGAIIKYEGCVVDDPQFDYPASAYTIVGRQLNWKKVVERGGLHRQIISLAGNHVLLGVTSAGLPVCQDVTENAECRPFIAAGAMLDPICVPEDDWFDYD